MVISLHFQVKCKQSISRDLFSKVVMFLVFKGLVGWTKKMTATQPNPTECNQTIGSQTPTLEVAEMRFIVSNF
jgi:hypothetical protein